MKNQKALARDQDWQTLLSELNEERPDQRKVRKLMIQFGLQYTNDPIEQMSQCLLHFDQIQGSKINKDSGAEL